MSRRRMGHRNGTGRVRSSAVAPSAVRDGPHRCASIGPGGNCRTLYPTMSRDGPNPPCPGSVPAIHRLEYPAPDPRRVARWPHPRTGPGSIGPRLLRSNVGRNCVAVVPSRPRSTTYPPSPCTPTLVVGVARSNLLAAGATSAKVGPSPYVGRGRVARRGCGERFLRGVRGTAHASPFSLRASRQPLYVVTGR